MLFATVSAGISARQRGEGHPGRVDLRHEFRAVDRGVPVVPPAAGELPVRGAVAPPPARGGARRGRPGAAPAPRGPSARPRSASRVSTASRVWCRRGRRWPCRRPPPRPRNGAGHGEEKPLRALPAARADEPVACHASSASGVGQMASACPVRDRDPAVGLLGPGEAFGRPQGEGRIPRDPRERQRGPGRRRGTETAPCALREAAVIQGGPSQLAQSGNAGVCRRRRTKCRVHGRYNARLAAGAVIFPDRTILCRRCRSSPESVLRCRRGLH